MLGVIDRLTRAVALYGGGGALFALLGLIVADVTGRYGFNAPIFGSRDVYGVLLALIVAVSIGYGGRSGAHVAADVFTHLIGPRTERVIGLLTKLLAAVIMAAAAWQLFVSGRLAARLGESTQLLGIPFQPVYAALGVGFGIYAIVLILEAWTIVMAGHAPLLTETASAPEPPE
jgi:TRAP-type transport system small permease protein